MVRQRVRIRFAKRGDLRLIGHRDLARLLERLFRRAGLRLARSQGFHPKPRMSFPSALALGIEGLDEVMEVELAQACSAEELLNRLCEQAWGGLEFHCVEVLPAGARKARATGAAYQVPIPPEHRHEAAARAARLMAGSACPVHRAGGREAVDVRQALEELSLHEGLLVMRLAMGSGPVAQARDVLQALGLAGLEQEGVCITRTRVEIEA